MSYTINIFTNSRFRLQLQLLILLTVPPCHHWAAQRCQDQCDLWSRRWATVLANHGYLLNSGLPTTWTSRECCLEKDASNRISQCLGVWSQHDWFQWFESWNNKKKDWASLKTKVQTQEVQLSKSTADSSAWPLHWQLPWVTKPQNAVSLAQMMHPGKRGKACQARKWIWKSISILSADLHSTGFFHNCKIDTLNRDQPATRSKRQLDTHCNCSNPLRSLSAALMEYYSWSFPSDTSWKIQVPLRRLLGHVLWPGQRCIQTTSVKKQREGILTDFQSLDASSVLETCGV